MKETHASTIAGPLNPRKLVSRAQYEPLLSVYLARDYKDEEWIIQSLEQAANTFFAVADLVNIKSSPTDPGGFHLSIPSASRIAALLEMAGALLLLGQTKKDVEMWLLENHHKCISPIRSNLGVRLEIECDWRLTRDGCNYVFTFNTVISGTDGGKFNRGATYMVPKPND